MLKLQDIKIQKFEHEFTFSYRAKFDVHIQSEVSKTSFIDAKEPDMLEVHIKESLCSALMNHAYGDFKADIFKLMSLSQHLIMLHDEMDNSDLLQVLK